MKKNMVFLVIASSVLLILFFLSSRNKVPFIPADDLHRSIVTAADCGECHAFGKRAPLKETHPPKEQCLICHKVKR